MPESHDMHENVENYLDTNNQKKEYMEWMDFARVDYECAKYLNHAPFYPKPLNVVCYH